jgi:hypothetical protein
MTENSDWKDIAAAGKEAKFNSEAARLKQQLDLERRAHTATLAALEEARLVASGPLPAPPTPAKRAKLKGDEVEVIFGDVHGNHHDPAAFSALLADLKIIKPHRVIIGGDFINCGGFLAEHHTLGYVAESQDSYEEDIVVANRLLSAIQEHSNASEILYIEGNHEWRVERWALTQRLSHHKDTELLRRTFCAQHVLNLEKRGIKYFPQGQTHPGCQVPGWIKLGKVYFTHKIAGGSDAAETALRKVGGNIVFFDTHRATFKPRHIPNIGTVGAWNPGCLCKRQPMYAHTNPTGWTHGYLVRHVSRTGNFQIVNVSIADGVSFGSLMLRGSSNE